MRKSAAVILSAAAIIMFSGDAEARRLSFSFGSKSVAKPVAPVAKPVAANASAASTRGGTFVVIGTGGNQNRPFAAAPRDPVPAPGPLHDLAYAAAQMPPEKSAEQPIEQKAELPAPQITPVFISQAVPVAKPVEKPAQRVASVQPAKTVYCVKQANGGCAPF